MTKPSLPKGFRDFLPQAVAKRQYLIDTLEKHFKRFGFAPIQTPAMEKTEVLLGKYGDEGDRLIFKILNSGDFLRKVPDEVYRSKDSRRLAPYISEKALRYDLTVPLARFVAQHQSELTFPFKRYQIQSVWRADRPQKGRFREFVQCDADVVGGKSLWQDAEMVLLYDAVFTEWQLPVTIRINNRKILSGLVEALNLADKEKAFLTALDKMDKIGPEGVRAEMEKAGMPEEALNTLDRIWQLNRHGDVWAFLRDLLKDSSVGTEGLDELISVREKVDKAGLQSAELKFDLTLARGLDYYTGSIFEVSARSVSVGSIGGGGRYDDLTGIFGLKDMSGIGISFGLDRIELVMDELGLWKDVTPVQPQVLFLNFGEAEAAYIWPVMQELRRRGISAELYPTSAKLKKQMHYADKKNIPLVVMVGDREMKDGTFILKKMTDGSQEVLPIDDIYRKIADETNTSL